MGKKTIVTCDCCGTDVLGKLYFTVNRQVLYDKQTGDPAIYLCPNCFRRTKLVSLLLDLEEMAKEDYLK